MEPRQEPRRGATSGLVGPQARDEDAHMAAAAVERPLVSGIVIGRLVRVRADGLAEVDSAVGLSGVPLTARVVSGAAEALVGRRVALMFENGDIARPIVIGPIEEPDDIESDSQEVTLAGDAVGAQPLTVQADDDELVISANRRVTIRCGESSITLTKAGKIIIRGKYILSRSSGVNRIKGGAVQIN